MFRLPKCPHCGTVYHYKDVSRAASQKDNTCYHCSKIFRAKRFPGIIVISAIMLILCIGTNLLILSRLKTLNLIVLFCVTLGYIALWYVIIPFFVTFTSSGNEEKKRR